MDHKHQKSTLTPTLKPPTGKGSSGGDLGLSNSEVLDELDHDEEQEHGDLSDEEHLLSTGGPPTGDGDPPADDEEGPPAKATGEGSPEVDDTEPDLDKPQEVGASDDVKATENGDSEPPDMGNETSLSEAEPLDVSTGGPGDEDPGSGQVEGPKLLPVPTVVTPTEPRAPVGSLDGEALDQFIAETGMSPSEHAAVLQSNLTDATSESTAAQGAVLAARDEHLADVQTATEGATTAVETAISTGRGRVDGAFRTAGSKIVDEANKGITKVDKDYEGGVGQLGTTAQGRRGEITGAMTESEGAVQAAREKGTQEYLTLLQTGAAGLDAIGTEVKAEAVKSGNELAKTYEGAAKGAKGLDSLNEESKAEIAKGVGTGAGNAIDMRVKVRKHNLESKASAAAESAVKNETETLQTELETTRTAADGNVTTATTGAVAKLGASRDTAKGTLETARDSANTRAEEERERAQARIDTAEETLRTDAENMAAELANSIEVRAASDAGAYPKVIDGLRDIIDGLPDLYRAADLVPSISSAVESIQAMSGEHLKGLGELASGGITTFETGVDKKIDAFDEAVEAQEGEATRFYEEQVKVISDAVGGFSGGIGGMVVAFDQELALQVGPVGEKAKKVQEGAAAAIEKYKELVVCAFEGVELELKEIAAQEIEKIPQAVEDGAGAKTMSKRTAIVSNDIPGLFSAMDGWGTDESGIYKILRKMSWGQIEALEVLWNQYKKHSLRWYFEDEMSGSDLETAIAYLNHDRVKALKLELEDSVGFWNDDEARIEEVMRSASADEMSTLTVEHRGTLDSVKSNLGGADLATFNALADTSMAREDALLKADAIRLHDAMDGMGTDEAKVKSILEGAKTPEEREKLRAFYASYTGEVGDTMSLDARLDYEFTGVFGAESDIHLVKELAKVERDDAAVSAAKVFAAGDGAGTDETAMFDALKSDVGKWDTEIAQLQAALTNGEERTADQQAEIEIRLAELQNKKSSHFDTLDSKIAEFSGKKNMTMEGYVKSELQEGLELKIGLDTLQKGKSDPADLVLYATDGMGTDEDLLKKALQDDSGNPLSKEEISKINQTLIMQGKPPLTAIVDSELSGRDRHDTTKLLLGKPETPEDLKRLVDMDFEFENSGFGRGLMYVKGALGMSTAMEEMDYAKENFDDKYAELEARGLTETRLDEIAQSDPELAQVIKELGITSQKSSEAYGKSLASTVDALVTALEIIGGIIATIATAGAASPALALLIANIAIGTTGIIIKKGLLGDTYAWEEAGADFVKMASTAALGAGLSKVEKFGKVAEVVGKKGTDLFQAAGTKSGMFFTGKAWELGPKSTAYLNTFFKAGAEEMMTGTVTDFYGGLWNDKNWDKGMDHWLGGAASGTFSNMHQNFLSGGSSAMFSKYLGDQKKEDFLKRAEARGVDITNIDPATLTHGSLLDDMLYGARDGLGKHVVSHVTNLSNYSDAGQFWEGLVSGGPKAMLKGALSAYGTRQALPANVARDLASGAMSAEQYALLHGELTPEEQLKIGRGLPPSRMPPVLASLVSQEANDKLTSNAASADGSAQPSYDKDKILEADAATLAQALRGGLSFADIQDRSFTPAERLLIAHIAAGTDKLPANFLDDVSVADFRKLEGARVVVAVEIGWDRVPEALRKDAIEEIESGSVKSTYGLLTRFQGQDLPQDLRTAVVASSGNMSQAELIKLGQSYGFDQLSKIDPAVEGRVAGAVGTEVKTGGSKDPGLVAAAIKLGQVDLTEEGLAGLGLTGAQKLDVLSSLGSTYNMNQLPKDFRDDAMASVVTLLPKKRLEVAKSTWSLLDGGTRDVIWEQVNKGDLEGQLRFMASVPSADIPASMVSELAKDLKYYEVISSLGGGSNLKDSELKKLRDLAGVGATP